MNIEKILEGIFENGEIPILLNVDGEDIELEFVFVDNKKVFGKYTDVVILKDVDNEYKKLKDTIEELEMEIVELKEKITCSVV